MTDQEQIAALQRALWAAIGVDGQEYLGKLTAHSAQQNYNASEIIAGYPAAWVNPDDLPMGFSMLRHRSLRPVKLLRSTGLVDDRGDCQRPTALGVALVLAMRGRQDGP